MTMIYSLLSEVQDAELCKSTKRQVKALARITDLFAAGSGNYSRDQIELFEGVYKVLVEVIELKTRVRLAQLIATSPNAPAPLARALACDGDIAVAGPVLSHSIVLSDDDIALSARTQSQDHLYAIALRPVLGEAITDILVERGESHVVRAVAKNAGARITDQGFGSLILKASDDSELALHIGLRRDVPRHHFVRLLEIVSAEVCNKIIAADPQFSNIAHDAVTEVIDEINDEVRDASPKHAQARTKVRRLKYWKELGEAKVHAAARAQDFEQAILSLSILARCPIEVAERAILLENPGAVQVVGKAAGCNWATVKSLLLMRAADRRMSKMDLDRAQQNYQRLEAQTAKRVLEFYELRRNRFDAAKAKVSGASTNVSALTNSEQSQSRSQFAVFAQPYR